MEASLVEVTLPSTSLVVSSIATATRRTTTVPTTKEWKLKGIQSLIPYSNPQAQMLLHWRGPGQRRLKATPKGPARTAQRELEADPEGHSISLGKARGLKEDLNVDPLRT